jgi:hypothetical protein
VPRATPRTPTLLSARCDKRALFASDTIEEKEEKHRRGERERERERKEEEEAVHLGKRGSLVARSPPFSTSDLLSNLFFLQLPPPPKKKKKQALLQLEYPDKLQRLLLTPQREVLVELVITRDNGEIEVKGGGDLRRKRGRVDFPTLETFFLSSTLRKKKK